jgi:hypothetical protein
MDALHPQDAEPLTLDEVGPTLDALRDALSTRLGT